MVTTGFVVISYDLASDRNRRRVAKLLGAHGVRVQKSVFECALSRRGLEELRTRLRPLLKPGDSIRYYRLCSGCLQQQAADGTTQRYLADPVLDV